MGPVDTSFNLTYDWEFLDGVPKVGQHVLARNIGGTDFVGVVTDVSYDPETGDTEVEIKIVEFAEENE